MLEPRKLTILFLVLPGWVAHCDQQVLQGAAAPVVPGLQAHSHIGGELEGLKKAPVAQQDQEVVLNQPAGAQARQGQMVGGCWPSTSWTGANAAMLSPAFKGVQRSKGQARSSCGPPTGQGVRLHGGLRQLLPQAPSLSLPYCPPELEVSPSSPCATSQPQHPT